eukprot:m.226227 g.226227  ORF g.226227 m.226227 type:complete len:444 (+) comp18793_c0_seq1:273-1604(+)
MRRNFNREPRTMASWLSGVWGRHPCGSVTAAAALLRLVLIVLGELIDNGCLVVSSQGQGSAPRYTDVDYDVYSQAAQHVVAGRSPYARATYRYTPLLAWLMCPGIWLGLPAFGKLVFAAADVGVGAIAMRVLQRHRGVSAHTAARLAAALLLFNPVTAAVSTRGNAEPLLGLVVLGALAFALDNRPFASGILLGAAVHLKLYPVIYVPAVFLHQGSHHKKQQHQHPLLALLRSLVSNARVDFVLGVVLSFATLTLAMFLRYGPEFVQETYLYHVTRQDNRHNFSVYFYAMYLVHGTVWARGLALAAFLPQATLVATAALCLARRDLPLAWFAQTVVFVLFNKVCTSQYFVWYLWLLPLVATSSRLSARAALACVAVWLCSQGLWLGAAYLLEFRGLNSFFWIWIAGVVMFVSHSVLLGVIVANHQFTTKTALAKASGFKAHAS